MWKELINVKYPINLELTHPQKIEVKMAAIKVGKTVKQWVKEAILEKLEKETQHG